MNNKYCCLLSTLDAMHFPCINSNYMDNFIFHWQGRGAIALLDNQSPKYNHCHHYELILLITSSIRLSIIKRHRQVRKVFKKLNMPSVIKCEKSGCQGGSVS